MQYLRAVPGENGGTIEGTIEGNETACQTCNPRVKLRGFLTMSAEWSD